MATFCHCYESLSGNPRLSPQLQREVLPDKLILADFKTPDVGGLEAKMAFDAGADMMTVIGGAALATVASALEAARAAGKEMLMELTGVRDIIARAGGRATSGVTGAGVACAGVAGAGVDAQPASHASDNTTVIQRITCVEGNNRILVRRPVV